MTIVEIARFAAGANSIPLPGGPVLQLPGGSLAVFNQGRVFAHEKWIIAVGFAPDLFLTLGSCSRRHVPSALREQLIGYLTACGAEVVRLRIRFPLSWHNPSDLRRTLAYWTIRLVESLSISLEPQLGVSRPKLILPVGVLARQAQSEWSLVSRIWFALEEEHPRALPLLQSLLWDTSHHWEIRWSLILREAQRSDDVSLEERSDIEHCDRTWMPLVRRYLEPHGYEVLPDTMTRFL